MSRHARLDLLFLLLVGIPAAIFLCKPWLGETALYALASERRLLFLGSLSKLLFLLLSALFAWKSALSFERDNPVRSAWLLLAGGLSGFFLGQLSLAPYQLLWNKPSPFPSIGDLFFVLGYVFLISALAAFLRGYEQAGLPFGSSAERWTLAGVAAAVCLVLGYVVLKPIVAAPAAGLEKALNVAYPSLDFILLIPTLLLLRITLRLRGGLIGKVWMLLLAGFVLMSAGDVLFAYFSGLGLQHLDPIIDAIYVLAYGSFARGTLCQRELLG